LQIISSGNSNILPEIVKYYATATLLYLLRYSMVWYAGLLKKELKAGEIVKWLKENFDLGHGHAMAIYATFKGKRE